MIDGHQGLLITRVLEVERKTFVEEKTIYRQGYPYIDLL